MPSMRDISSPMRWVSFGCVLLGFAVGCTKKNPILVCNDGQCSDPQYSYCDVDGAVAGEPNTCVKADCTANQFVTCDGSNAIACNADANGYVQTACPFGCSAADSGCKQCAADTTSCGSNAVLSCDSSGSLHSQACPVGCADTPSPHCAHLVPRYLPNVCDTPAVQPVFDVVNSGTIDSNTDANCTGGVITQTGGPDICVVRYGTITIEANQTLTGVPHNGSPNRALAFVSDGPLTIAGTLDVSARSVQSGPGGGGTFSGGSWMGTFGGGGAGFKTAGGAGGNATTDGGAGNGGASSQNPALFDALIGGASNQGGGGGALTLISCQDSVIVTPTGIVAAGGGGAFGGSNAGIGGATGGGGGGAGGYVVLQGIGVSVTGAIYANGGGGGGGADTTLNGGFPGQDARRGTTCASGGASRSGSGRGGDGGCLSGLPQFGSHPTTANTAAGGGGGSTGFIQTYTPAGVTPTITPLEASPAFELNANIPTR